METFKIEIKEFLSRIIEVEANSIDEAISKVRQMYKNEDGDYDFVMWRLKNLIEESK
jgi:hypothetical protein